MPLWCLTVLVVFVGLTAAVSLAAPLLVGAVVFLVSLVPCCLVFVLQVPRQLLNHCSAFEQLPGPAGLRAVGGVPMFCPCRSSCHLSSSAE